MANAAIVGLK